MKRTWLLPRPPSTNAHQLSSDLWNKHLATWNVYTFALQRTLPHNETELKAGSTENHVAQFVKHENSSAHPLCSRSSFPRDRRSNVIRQCGHIHFVGSGRWDNFDAGRIFQNYYLTIEIALQSTLWQKTPWFMSKLPKKTASFLFRWY